MSRKVLHTDQAPAAIGTYSQAIQVDNTVYASGQIPLDPATGELVGGEFADQVRRVFANLNAIAATAGGTLNDAVKYNVFLTDLANFAIVNAVMEEVLEAPYPARAALQVSALPKGAEVEVDAIFVI